MIPSTFDALLDELDQLKGRELKSVRPGADIMLTNVDRKNLRVELRTSSGSIRTRPLSELQRIWNALLTTPAIHVDSVLGGSGSSRNQPETLMANLPFIEWTKVGKLKHLVLVQTETHQHGTLKEMDSFAAQAVRERLAAQQRPPVSAVVIARDPGATAVHLQVALGGVTETLSTDLYEVHTQSCVLVVAGLSDINTLEGTYAVVREVKVVQKGPIVVIRDERFSLVRAGQGLLAVKLS